MTCPPWLDDRLPEHVAPVDEVTWVTDDGLRCLRPEIALLFKAAQDRPKDRRDLEVSWPLLEESRRRWLRAAVLAAYGPDHAWVPLVE